MYQKKQRKDLSLAAKRGTGLQIGVGVLTPFVEFVSS